MKRSTCMALIGCQAQKLMSEVTPSFQALTRKHAQSNDQIIGLISSQVLILFNTLLFNDFISYTF